MQTQGRASRRLQHSNRAAASGSRRNPHADNEAQDPEERQALAGIAAGKQLRTERPRAWKRLPCPVSHPEVSGHGGRDTCCGQKPPLPALRPRRGPPRGKSRPRPRQDPLARDRPPAPGASPGQAAKPPAGCESPNCRAGRQPPRSAPTAVPRGAWRPPRPLGSAARAPRTPQAPAWLSASARPAGARRGRPATRTAPRLGLPSGNATPFLPPRRTPGSVRLSRAQSLGLWSSVTARGAGGARCPSQGGVRVCSWGEPARQGRGARTKARGARGASAQLPRSSALPSVRFLLASPRPQPRHRVPAAARHQPRTASLTRAPPAPEPGSSASAPGAGPGAGRGERPGRRTALWEVWF